MNKHLSNWHFNQEFSHPMDPRKPQKRKLAYYCCGLLLAAGGAWLVLSLLGAQGIHPFSTQSAPLEEPLVEFFSPSVSAWSDEIQNWAEAWGLDPLLVATVMQIESCGDPEALSPAGAQGLFQVMPYHFEPDEDTLDPDTNAKRGLAYLQQSFELSEGDIEGTLAGYNGGHGQIAREKSQWPEETQRYVRWGSAIYREAALGEGRGKALSAWLDAGGWQLCQAAEARLHLD